MATVFCKNAFFIIDDETGVELEGRYNQELTCNTATAEKLVAADLAEWVYPVAEATAPEPEAVVTPAAPKGKTAKGKA